MFYEVPRWYLNRIHIIDKQWIRAWKEFVNYNFIKKKQKHNYYYNFCFCICNEVNK